MNIVTLNIPGLDWQTGVLAKQIVNDHPAPFRVILAVKKGGSFVARSFLKSYPAELVEFFGEVDLHRPSTKYKKGTLVRMLPHVPLWILNSMRRTEATWLKMKQHLREPRVPHLALEPEIADRLRDGVPEVLLIDDAVDSGTTARGVIDAVLRINPKARVKVMAITVTTDSPLVMADYYTYNNGTLVRFPWSKDYKNR